MKSKSLVLVVAVVTAALGCSAPDSTPHTTKEASEPPGASTATTTAASAAPVSDELAQKLRVLDPNVYRMPVEGLPALGNPGALVTVVFFSDYECPFCQRLEGELTKLRTEHPDDVRIVFAPRPLQMHPRARPAALASLAAATQGKFAEMHERLGEGKLDPEAIALAAQELGLDLARFDADRGPGGEGPKTLARLNELTTRLSLVGTPVVFINGRRVTGAQRDVVRQVVLDQLASAKSLVAKGTDRRQIYETITGKGLETAERDPSLTLLPRFAPPAKPLPARQP